ncbi:MULTISPECIES: hypothetical protein [unclassified Streptomyces]|uniref:hypothetical protein n=1 Tax=unclassified Streptomyces TaxID=2593676 RepID=UPI00168B1053|nr:MULTISPECIES: hypothetical protein [unclassified Streptomyces]MBD3006439.1 hypothetical protein [Streptomyces sp. 5-10]
MSDHSDKVTEEQVRERAAQIRERLKRWEKTEGFALAAALDVEAAARRALEVRSRPKPSAHDVLKAIRPEWEKEAAQQGLIGEALDAFKRQILDSDAPQVFCDMEGFLGLEYHIHLNKAAVEVISWNTDVVLEALEWATVAVPKIDEILSPLEAFIRAAAIQEVGAANSNGQAQLVGVWPVPIPIVESDDRVWGVLGDLLGH